MGSPAVPARPRSADGHRFLVFRNGMLGNTLMAEPFLRALREAWPSCRIALVTDPVGRELLRTHPLVDEFFLFDKATAPLSAQLALVRTWRERRFDASFHLRTGVRNELLAFLSGIPARVGTKLKGSFQFLTHTQPKREHLHVHDALSAFASAIIGRDIHLPPPRLTPDPEAGARAEAFLSSKGLTPGRYLALHLGGRTCHGLEFGPRAFAAPLAAIQQRLGLSALLLGTPDEAPPIAAAFPESPTLAHAFGQPMGVSSELIRRAAAFLGNDSGPAHVAEAWDIPKVVAYPDDPANFEKWKPLAPERSLALSRARFAEPTIAQTIADWLAARI
jgi:ADP-heptose:LPS heptosyltransferase